MAIADFASASSLFQLVVLITWTVLCDTPFPYGNTLFVLHFPALQALESTASIASLAFAPGLWDVMQAASPPAIAWYKILPDATETIRRFAIYFLTLEKPGCRSRLYCGSGTDETWGVVGRMWQYHSGSAIPVYVQQSLDEGFVITHKGLICWMPLPSASLVPINRLLFKALEAAFSYIFGATRPTAHGFFNAKTYLWERTAFEYDGLCSHSAICEGVIGGFDLSEEQLEKSFAQRKAKAAELHNINNTHWHYHKMETDYADYMSSSVERVAKSRASNPGRDAKRQDERITKARSEQRWYCPTCNHNSGTKQRYDNHMKSVAHKVQAKRTEMGFKNLFPFKCGKCNEAFPTNKARQAHVQVHSKVQPAKAQTQTTLSHSNNLDLAFPCAHCDASFSTKGGLVRHEKTHKAAADA